jgi:hypothetical protein
MKEHKTPLHERPVMYLDVDDTLIDWGSNRPEAGAGAKEFLLWALENYEVRWLTMWAPGGVLTQSRADELAYVLDVEPELLTSIVGLDFYRTHDKVDGIDWDEVAQGRPWVWVEDAQWIGDNLRAKLQRKGLLQHWIMVDVTREPDSLKRAHARLEEQCQRSRSETEPSVAAEVRVA